MATGQMVLPLVLTSLLEGACEQELAAGTSEHRLSLSQFRSRLELFYRFRKRASNPLVFPLALPLTRPVFESLRGKPGVLRLGVLMAQNGQADVRAAWPAGAAGRSTAKT